MVLVVTVEEYLKMNASKWGKGSQNSSGVLKVVALLPHNV
jgi:hypothetical protein